jgi:hypothetical protein
MNTIEITLDIIVAFAARFEAKLGRGISPDNLPAFFVP